MFAVYLLSTKTGNHTYVGSTRCVPSRLKRHNSGRGGRTTKGKQWVLVACVHGFQSRARACQFERYIKKKARGSQRGHTAVQNRFMKLMNTFEHFREQWNGALRLRCVDHSMIGPKLLNFEHLFTQDQE